MKYQIVMVEWFDAEGATGWADAADERKFQLHPCYSVGWLIHEDNQRIVLCGCLNPEKDEISNREYIPVGMIIKRTTMWHPESDRDWREMWDKDFGRPELV